MRENRNGEEMRITQKSQASDEHIKLADSIKSVHANLRQRLRDGEQFYQVWNEHLQDDKVLESYSNAMNTLANQHWTKLVTESEDTSRILWTKNKILEYYQNGGLTNQLIRDNNRLKRNHEKINEGIKVQHEKDETKKEIKIEIDNSTEHKTIKDRLKLLDVGSCYNPFSKFTDFEVTALDIAPVYENQVFKADFLNLNIADKSEFTEREVISLKSTSFDIVVFCFLLEYLPSTRPRYECCVRAKHLLKENGILIILTPDSCHQQRNNSIIRGWKEALVQIGFQRVYYEKKQHFHGLVFRKLGEVQHSLALEEANLPRIAKGSFGRDATDNVIADDNIAVTIEEVAAKFVIPQDFNTSEPNLLKKRPEAIKLEEKNGTDIAQDFHQLPDL